PRNLTAVYRRRPPLVRRTPRAQTDKRSPSRTTLALSPLLPHRANAISSPPAPPYPAPEALSNPRTDRYRTHYGSVYISRTNRGTCRGNATAVGFVEVDARRRLAQRAGIRTVARLASRSFRSPTVNKSRKSANCSLKTQIPPQSSGGASRRPPVQRG